MAVKLALLLPVILPYFFIYTHALCYFPDGKSVASQDTPCYANQNSTCCGQGFACMSNGLCMLTSYVLGAGPGQSIYVRGSCSDPNWGANCPNFCVTPSHGDTLGGAMGLQKCLDNSVDSYFCLDRATDNITSTITASAAASSTLCANLGGLVHFQGTPTTIAIIGVSSASSTAVATSLAAASTSSRTTDSSSTTASASSTSASPSSPATAAVSTNLAVAVGAGVGVPLGLVALSVIAFFVWRYRQSQKRSAQEMENKILSHDTKYRSVPDQDGSYAAQRVVQSSPAEMPWERQAHELPGDSTATR